MIKSISTMYNEIGVKGIILRLLIVVGLLAGFLVLLVIGIILFTFFFADQFPS